ncbi:MAG: hypothetical protein L0Z62_03370, partial [Gemmataceae bacterium]|nr:hypothetical protein [Gemmataceae bacterium]
MHTLVALVLRVAVVPLALAYLLPAPCVRADEAVLLDGRRLPGELTQDRAGRLHFLPTATTSPLFLEQLQQVRWASAEQTSARVGSAYRLILRGGQWLSGELLGLDARTLSWRTFWGARLRVPRDAVAAVTHPPGLVTIFEEDFENHLKAWEVTGTPALSKRWHVSGQQGLVLAAPGQAVAYRLAEALEAGRVQLRFRDTSDKQPSNCLIEMQFESACGLRLLRVKPAEEADGFTVEGSEGPGVHQHVRRSSGWHHLSLEFSPGSLILTLDNAVLWHSRQQGPGGSLRGVRLARLGRKSTAAVAVDDFSLARSVEDLPQRREDPGQDEVWLLGGDQLLG